MTKLEPLFVRKGVESPPVLPAAGDVAPVLASSTLVEEVACSDAGVATEAVEEGKNDVSEEVRLTPSVSHRHRSRGSTRRARAAEDLQKIRCE